MLKNVIKKISIIDDFVQIIIAMDDEFIRKIY